MALKNALAEQIERLFEKGTTQFMSGMAEGTDTWAALSVLALRSKNKAIKLHCVLPCKEQADKWNPSAQKQYHSILGCADSVVYVNQYYHKDCMLERNHFLVDHSNILLAVYNGERRGGTAATVRYAQRSGREILILDPTTELVTCHEP